MKLNGFAMPLTLTQPRPHTSQYQIFQYIYVHNVWHAHHYMMHLTPCLTKLRVGSHPTFGPMDIPPILCKLPLSLSTLKISNQDFRTCPYRCMQLRNPMAPQGLAPLVPKCKGSLGTLPYDFTILPQTYKLMVLNARPSLHRSRMECPPQNEAYNRFLG